MLWVPSARLVVFRVATPPVTDAVPTVVPVIVSLKVTLPVGVRAPTGRLPGGGGTTVAVRTTCCPNEGAVVFALRSVVVVSFVDCSDTVLELAAKLESPG